MTPRLRLLRLCGGALRHGLGRAHPEDGFHMVELSVAMAVLSVAIIGVAGAMNLGIVATGSAKQRSKAAAVAAERIERVRNLPYEEVALDVMPSHNTDPDHPDHHVTTGSPPSYDVNRDGSLYETLLDGGSLLHVEDPVLAGETELFAYQYVTWVDDPSIAGSTDYKRVTLVVTWRNPLNPGTDETVTVSTFVGEGSVTVPQATPAPASASPTPTPSPAPDGDGGCDGDVTPPTGSIEILSGTGGETGYTDSTSVQVHLDASDDCTSVDGELSNDDANYTTVTTLTQDAEGNWVPQTVAWTVPAGDGTKTVFGRFVDGAGNTSVVSQDTIVLDQTDPTVPGTLSEVSCSISGNDRTVNLTWGASTDTNLSGYRLHRSIDSGAWEIVATVGSTSAADTTRKTYDSVRYLVRAFDKAGNASGDSNTLTYGKNAC